MWHVWGREKLHVGFCEKVWNHTETSCKAMRMWERNNWMVLQEMWWVGAEWTNPMQVTDKWLDLWAAMKIPVPHNAVKFLSRWWTITFSRRISIHGDTWLYEGVLIRRNWPTWAFSILINHPILRIWHRRTTTCSLDWKKQLKGRHFSSGEEIISAAETCLDGQHSECFWVVCKS